MHYPKFPIEKVNFLLNLGGLGDNIARMPVINYIHNRHPHVKSIVWVADYFLPLSKNMLPEIIFKPFSDNKNYNEKLPSRMSGWEGCTNLKTHMVDHAFFVLANEIPPIEHRNYCQLKLDDINIKRFNLPQKYVVMTTGFTAPIREFLPEYINRITDYIVLKGYQVVFLGSKHTSAGVKGHEIIGNFKEDIDFSKGINLVDKTTLLEAARIIRDAKTIVGLDNGLLHLAACTGDIPIVAGFTSVMPEHRAPYRHNQLGYNFFPVVPPETEPERYCQSIWDFTFNHDFRHSYYKNDSLIKSLKPELYIEQLERIL